MKNYQAIFVTVGGFSTVFNTMNGTVQQYIKFSGPLNELAFACIGVMLGIIGLASIDYKKIYKALI
jgi:hypothetical protein